MDTITKLKSYEGTIQYQAKRGYFKEGKFWPYQDSLGFWTIGYGHLVLKGEDFSKGITEVQADVLLAGDIAKAKADVKKLNLVLPSDSRWNEFLVLMMFQLGLSKVLGFRKFLAALSTANYATAIAEVKNSKWYTQTKSRVDAMLRDVTNG